MKIHCPSCNQTYEVADSFAGKQVACNCGNQLSVPATSNQPPIVTQPQAPPSPLPVAPAPSGRATLVVASVLVGFIFGAIVGGAGYALLIAPKNLPPSPAIVAEKAPEQTPSADPSPPQPVIPVTGLVTPRDPGSTDTAVDETRPPNRQLTRDEIVFWSEKVGNELKILAVSQPGALQVLEKNPQAFHVVQVGDDCTAAKFNSNEAQLLKNWVAGGGILWARNDVFSLFNVGFERRFASAWVGDCTPSLDPKVCPVLFAVEKVNIRWDHGKAADLSFERIIPLLSAATTAHGATESKKCLWSLIPYGKGWISDVQKFDETKFDGAQFWLNFRMFCLGWDIPGAKMSNSDFRKQYTETAGVPLTGAGTDNRLVPPGQGGLVASPAALAKQPTVVTTSDELDKALAEGASQRALWVQLAEADVGKESLAKLKQWVEQGGVLWIDTDLGTPFEFPMFEMSANKVPDQAMVAKVTHAVLEGIEPGQNVGFTLAPQRYVVTGTWTALNREMTPILGWPAPTPNRLFTCCALRPLGKGTVIFRPREITINTNAGRILNENLRKYSFR